MKLIIIALSLCAGAIAMAEPTWYCEVSCRHLQLNKDNSCGLAYDLKRDEGVTPVQVLDQLAESCRALSQRSGCGDDFALLSLSDKGEVTWNPATVANSCHKY